jgi:uncharacterized protein (TIRG00374 family)
MLAVILRLLVSAIVLYRHPRKLKRFLAIMGKLIDIPVEKFTNKSMYDSRGLVYNVNSFYQAMEVARKNPLETGKAFIYATMTLFADILSLFFVFYALGFPIRLEVLVVGYIITNYVVSLLLMPEGIGITELSLSAVYTSLGVPSSTVVVAILLFRFIAFWLPIGVGLLAMWDLRRKSLI